MRERSQGGARSHARAGGDASDDATASRTSDAIALAYDVHAPDLYSYALRATHDVSAAEDAVQEAFLRLTREIARGREPDDARAWLFRVTTNLVVSGGRRAQIARRFRHLFVERATADPVDTVAIQNERDSALRAELDKLSPSDRAGLLLAAHGFSMRDIGAALGRSEGAARVLVCRARLTLRRSLEASEVFRE